MSKTSTTITYSDHEIYFKLVHTVAALLGFHFIPGKATVESIKEIY
ncbi:MAG TPA: hypothetical protein VK622_11580 [Puia sp.]|nr:hypothetical protein [Puia sp.]